MSLLRPRSIHPPAHQSYPFIGHRLTVRRHTGIIASLVFFGSQSRPQVSPPSQRPAPLTLATILCTNDYYQLIYALYA